MYLGTSNKLDSYQNNYFSFLSVSDFTDYFNISVKTGGITITK